MIGRSPIATQATGRGLFEYQIASVGIVPDSLIIGTSIDSPQLLQAHVIIPEGVLNGVDLESAALEIAGVIGPDPLVVGQLLQSPSVDQLHNITPGNLTQSTRLDPATIAANYSIITDSLISAQGLQSADLSVGGEVIAASGMISGVGLAVAALVEHNIITPDILTQAQALQIARLGGVVSGSIGGELFIYAMIEGELVVGALIGGELIIEN